MVYVGFWVGVPFASLLFGDVFRLLSPWRAIGRATGWVAARAGTLPEPLDYPERLGRWPAAAGLFAFAICELCWAKAGEPGPLALLMLVYLVVMLVGMSLYGVEPWVRNADAFGVLFSLIASLAPIGRGEDGRLVLRVPFSGAAKLEPVAGDGRAAGHRDRLDGVRRRPRGRAVQRPRAGPAGLLQRPRRLALAGARARLRRRAGAGRGDRRRDLGARHGGHEADGEGAEPHGRSPAPSATRSRRSPPATSSRTTSRCWPTAARACGGSPAIRSATARTCSAAPDRRSTTASSAPPASGTSRSARWSSATSPRSCWPTTARSSSTVPRVTPHARRSSCWC